VSTILLASAVDARGALGRVAAARSDPFGMLVLLGGIVGLYLLWVVLSDR
jgi:hypothetical protein